MATLTPASVFRRYETDGVPESGKHNPDKSEIIQLLDDMQESAAVAVDVERQRALDAEAALGLRIEGAADGLVQTTSWTALSLITGTRVGQPGRVTGVDTGTHVDPVTAASVLNKGEYQWTGAAWTRASDLFTEVEFGRVGDALDALSDAGKVVYDLTDYVPGALRIDGTVDNDFNATHRTSGFLEARGIVPIYFSVTITLGIGYGICFYDATQTLIAGREGTVPGNTPIVPPIDARYFRFTGQNHEVADVAVKLGRTENLDTFNRLLNLAQEGRGALIYSAEEDSDELTVGALDVITQTLYPEYDQYRTTPFLPILGAGVTFSEGVSLGAPFGIAYYDFNKALIGYRTGAIFGGETIKPSWDTRFVRFSHLDTSTVVVRTPGVDAAQSQWAGRRAINLGDSISADTNFFLSVCADLGITQVLNASRSGRNTSKALFRADDVTPLIESDFANVDLCFMLLGTNNVTANLGSMADGVGGGTVYGQIREAIETIMGWQPNIRFVISTLLWRDTDREKIPALNAAITEIAHYYAIPLCDLNKISGFNEFNMDWAMPDGLHPSAFGYQRCMIPAVKGFLRSIDPAA